MGLRGSYRYFSHQQTPKMFRNDSKSRIYGDAPRKQSRSRYGNLDQVCPCGSLPRWLQRMLLFFVPLRCNTRHRKMQHTEKIAEGNAMTFLVSRALPNPLFCFLPDSTKEKVLCCPPARTHEHYVVYIKRQPKYVLHRDVIVCRIVHCRHYSISSKHRTSVGR